MEEIYERENAESRRFTKVMLEAMAAQSNQSQAPPTPSGGCGAASPPICKPDGPGTGGNDLFGNPVAPGSDFPASLGGPIVKDRLWFFGTSSSSPHSSPSRWGDYSSVNIDPSPAGGNALGPVLPIFGSPTSGNPLGPVLPVFASPPSRNPLGPLLPVFDGSLRPLPPIAPATTTLPTKPKTGIHPKTGLPYGVNPAAVPYLSDFNGTNAKAP